MIQISRYLTLFIATLVLYFPASLSALEFLDVNLPAPIQGAYNERHNDPERCIITTNKYIKDLQALYDDKNATPYQIESLNKNKTLSIQILALCNAQLEDYPQAYQLLSQLFKTQSFSVEQLRTLNLLASEIPERYRPEFSNQLLVKTLTTSLRQIDSSSVYKSPNFKTKLLLSISKLSLQNDQLRTANITLEAAKESLERTQNTNLTAWMNYYYGLYYGKINQQQLAVANLFTANKTAEKYNYTELSGEAKKSIADLYQQKYLFNRAIDFSSQRVEVYMKTKNHIKQIESLMQLAVLKGKNKKPNEALVYLFNALELVKDKKDNTLLAQVFLELGRVYSSQVTAKGDQKQRLLAQKYLQNARWHFTQLKDVRNQIESLLLLARLNLINEDPALAILQLEKSLKLASDQYPELSVRAFEMLASSYEITGNHQQAIAHFKNFHALQNRIKEHLFTLQQLQISEQLHLIERTQQKRHLEIENKALKDENKLFTLISYSSVALLIIAILSLFYTFIFNRKLAKSEHKLQRQLSVNPRTKLPSQQALGKGFNYPYNDIPLYYALVSIPFLDNLNELSGAIAGRKLEKKLGRHLLAFFEDNSDIFQIRDNKILFVSEQTNYQSAQLFAENIEQCFTQFTEKNNLSNNISIGIVAFPFLNNVSRAITSTRTLNLTSLALFGANQLRDTYQGSNWVELYAIDNLQPAFFDGDLWILGQKAIQKGIVKMNSNHQSHHFSWPELDD